MFEQIINEARAVLIDFKEELKEQKGLLKDIRRLLEYIYKEIKEGKK